MPNPDSPLQLSYWFVVYSISSRKRCSEKKMQPISRVFRRSEKHFRFYDLENSDAAHHLLWGSKSGGRNWDDFFPWQAKQYMLCSRVWYFIIYRNCSDLLWKKMFKWSRKTFEIRGGRLRICKMFEITRTIYSNSERSEQFLKQNAFLTCSWRFLRSSIFEQL